jgi:hypothetical protein
VRTRSWGLCGPNDTWRDIPDRQSPNVHVVAALSPRHNLHHPSALASPLPSPSHPLAPSFYTLPSPRLPNFVALSPFSLHRPPRAFTSRLRFRCSTHLPTYLTHSARETRALTMPFVRVSTQASAFITVRSRREPGYISPSLLRYRVWV